MWPRASHQPGEDQPQDVADAGRRARVAALDRRVAEGPQGVDADAERGDAEGDADDRDAEQHAREQVAEEQPEAAEDRAR